MLPLLAANHLKRPATKSMHFRDFRMYRLQLCTIVVPFAATLSFALITLCKVPMLLLLRNGC